MQKITFRNGFHLDIKSMDFIQEAYIKPIEALVSSSVEKNYVVSGVTRSSSGAIDTFSNGMVVLNGELMEFRGGSFNGNDEDAACYVVKRSEILYNENADGASDPALVRSYATLATAEEGGINIYTFVKRVLIPTISLPYASGLIATSLPYPSGGAAIGFGFYGDEARPRYSIGANTVALYGAFQVTGSGTILDFQLGQIPNWIGAFVDNIKCDMRAEGNQIFHGLAKIDTDGTIYAKKVPFESVVTINAIIFDGTAYPIIRYASKL